MGPGEDAEWIERIVVLEGRVTNIEKLAVSLQTDINLKHQENRQSIHGFRDKMQEVVDSVHALALSFTAYASQEKGASGVMSRVYTVAIGLVGGAATVGLAEMLKRLWK